MNHAQHTPAAACAMPPPAAQLAALPPSLTFLFAAAVGIIVMNLFAAQTLTGPIGAALGLPPRLSGIVAMLPQLGYAAGLVLLVPLVDVHENRRLIVLQLTACAGCLLLAAIARPAPLYMALVFVSGMAASAIQMLVPMAALMVTEPNRGRTVGNVMSGLMTGILFARPLASLVADLAGWRSVYAVLGVAVLTVALALARVLPQRRPAQGEGYARLLASLWRLLRDEPVLRKRAVVAAFAMAAFSAFWTSVGKLLAGPGFDLSQRGIAVFAFAGAAGAIAAPLAGRAGDRGHARACSLGGHAIAIGATVLAFAAGTGQLPHRWLAIALLCIAAMLLDAGVMADQTIGRRAINLLDPRARGRLNGLFVGIFFVGGALGSLLSGLAWAQAGWGAACTVQGLLLVAAMILAARIRD
jgi:predicted MFS family arabinose efflux permease